MNPRVLTLVVVLLVISVDAFAQEIPKGVRYQRASEALNTLAKTRLETALNSDKPAELFGTVAVIGPMLWKALEPSAEKVLLDMMPVGVVIPGPPPITAAGKRVLTVDQRDAFWKLFREKYGKSKEIKIRAAKAEELSYYWTTIPFDIDEPFFVIEADGNRFVVDFMVKDDKPTLFWIDLVGDLKTLKR
jgi:hypothetical protein